MRILHEYPLLRPLVAFIAGVAIPLNQEDHSCFHWVPLILLLISIIAYLFIHFLKLSSFGKNRSLTGMLALVAVFLSGYVLTQHRLFNNFSRADAVSDGVKALLIRVISPPEEKSRSLRMKAEVLGIYDRKDFHETGKPRFMAYIAKDGLKYRPVFGDILMVNGEVSRIPPPKNPGQFDYRLYLERKGILKQIRVRADGFSKLDSNTRPYILKIALDTRDLLLKELEEKGMSSAGYAVGAAILLGYDDHIAPELMRDYSDTGVIHVLCVSGMHLGIIYVLLDFLLVFMNRKLLLKRFKIILILAFIWFYSLVTGFSPSVLRSATMFSFLLAGQLSGRTVDIRNSLLASAFFLLLTDPLMITDIGLQLSYAAVFSIVLFNRHIQYWWIPRWWLIRKIWELTAVSISAQILVAPLVMFYFHKFSNYFIISNLLAIPLSTLVLYCGMLVLVFSPLEYAGLLLAKIFDWLIAALNAIVGFINHLPFSSFSSLNLDFERFILIYLIIFGIMGFLLNRRLSGILFTLSCLILFLGLSLVKQYGVLNQKLVIFYSVQGHTAISFAEGNTCYTLADSALIRDTLRYNFSIQPAIIRFNLHNHRLIPIETREYNKGGLIKYGNFISFHGLRVTFTGNTGKFVHYPSRYRTDYLYLNEPKEQDLPAQLKIYDFEKLVCSPSHRRYASDRLKSESKEAGVELIPLAEGAYMVNLQCE